jgi:hypothetical protein
MEQIWKEFEEYVQKTADDEIVPEPTNFYKFIQNLEGRKQLRYSDNCSMRRDFLTLYNNGQTLYTFHFRGYEMGYALDYLYDKLKFKYGYTEHEVYEAHSRYLHMLNNQLGGYDAQ